MHLYLTVVFVSPVSISLVETNPFRIIKARIVAKERRKERTPKEEINKKKTFTKRKSIKSYRTKQIVPRDIIEAFAHHQYSPDGTHPMLNSATLDRGRL